MIFLSHKRIKEEEEKIMKTRTEADSIGGGVLWRTVLESKGEFSNYRTCHE